MARLIVLDASVLLAYFDKRDAHTEAAKAILDDAEGLAASVLTVAESLVGAAAAHRLDEQLDALSDLEICRVPIGSDAAPTLAGLRSATGLKMPDCCVLHAAATIGADAIGTRDASLAKAAQERGYETP
ncbi:MAG TPA: PIN domain-containing protein [Solirubrobacteraceae bacterium]|nr:PIN domain-containing protein [Solirubrobacteraceae bacterium]